MVHKDDENRYEKRRCPDSLTYSTIIRPKPKLLGLKTWSLVHSCLLSPKRSLKRILKNSVEFVSQTPTKTRFYQFLIPPKFWTYYTWIWYVA